MYSICSGMAVALNALLCARVGLDACLRACLEPVGSKSSVQPFVYGLPGDSCVVPSWL